MIDPEIQRVIDAAVASVQEDTGGRLPEHRALLVAWERSVLEVAMGANADSEAFAMYGYGRGEIERRMAS